MTVLSSYTVSSKVLIKKNLSRIQQVCTLIRGCIFQDCYHCYSAAEFRLNIYDFTSCLSRERFSSYEQQIIINELTETEAGSLSSLLPRKLNNICSRTCIYDFESASASRIHQLWQEFNTVLSQVLSVLSLIH